VAVAAALVAGLAACGSDKKSGGGSTGASASASSGGAIKGKVAVLLPDTKSSARWEGADRPLLQKAFEAAGLKKDQISIVNAEGDAAKQATQADAALTAGASVVLLVNLDNGSGSAIEKKIVGQGAKVIDYDRLTLGGSADYYVSFNNVTVGKLQGQGLVDCLTAAKASKPIVAELNGSPDDNNATLFKQGYDSVLKPKYTDKTFVKGPDQAVPAWDNQTAATIFEQMLTGQPKIAGVLAANDGLGNAAISVLRKQNLNGKVPVTGQDATPQGLQNILNGDQCMTVYKPIKQEAESAAAMAVTLLRGQTPTNATAVSHDPTGNRDVKSILLQPQSITKANVAKPIQEGFVTKAEVCTGPFAAKCTAAGVT
jgi:D-xylose transport system substrate-binding protein